MNESTNSNSELCTEERFFRLFSVLPDYTCYVTDVQLTGAEDIVSGWNFFDAAGNLIEGVKVVNDMILDANGKVLGQIVDGAVKLNDGVVMSLANAGAVVTEAVGDATAQVVEATGDAVSKVNKSLTGFIKPVLIAAGVVGGGFLVYKLATAQNGGSSRNASSNE